MPIFFRYLEERGYNLMRYQNEINHGQYLAQKGAERVWGWETPAGKMRAMRRAKLIIESAGLKPGQRILEVGCGTGLFTEQFAGTGAYIVAVDISEDVLKSAINRKIPDGKVKFINKNFEECLNEGPFDAVIGSSILHHLDIRSALNNIFNLLKDGGTLSFAEPNFLNPQIFFQKNIPFLKRLLGDSPDETAFFRWHLHNLLENNDFKKIEILPFDWLHPFTPVNLIEPIQKIGEKLERTPYLCEFAGSLLIKASK